MTTAHIARNAEGAGENPFDSGYYHERELERFGFRSVGRNVQVARNCTILGLNNICLGNHVRIDSNVVIAAATGFLHLGDHIHIGAGCHLGCAGGVTLSDFSGLSQGVCIYSRSDDYRGNSLTNPTVPRRFQAATLAPVHLGRHVIVGSGSVILPGVVVGEGSAIGALSLVTKSLAAWGIYFGTPVRRLRRRSRKLLDLEAELRATEPPSRQPNPCMASTSSGQVGGS